MKSRFIRLAENGNLPRNNAPRLSTASPGVTSTSRGACRASSDSCLHPGSPLCRWGPLVLVAGHLGLSGLGRMPCYPPRPQRARHSRLLVTVRVLALPSSLERPIAVITKLARHQDRRGHRCAFFALVQTGVGIGTGRRSRVFDQYARTDDFLSAGGGNVL